MSHDGAEFFKGVLKSHPLAPTASTPGYSNAAFQILAYALENITGQSYRDLLAQHLLKPLNLTRSSYDKPDDKYGVIPGVWTDNYWNISAGDETP